MNQVIGLKQHDLTVTERGGPTGSYPGVSRQLRRRLNEIDKQIADLKARKAKLISA